MNTACCFTGHRFLPKEQTGLLNTRLTMEIDNCIAQGITTFISGGALGFDQLAAVAIAEKKKKCPSLRLILALPCKNQDARWTSAQRTTYEYLLSFADQIIYISEAYDRGCMKRRNYFMVDHSSHCICALLHGKSGTEQTVNYAKEKGLTVVNIARFT